MDTKPPECWACYNPRLGLRVELTPDHSSVLPYEHFIYSEYVDREGEEVRGKLRLGPCQGAVLGG